MRRLLGLMGWPVEHSLSPAMHNAAAAALGLDLVYLPLPVRPDDLADAVRGLPALGFLGVNVTVPHKEAVLPLLDQLDPAAETIGAVNTIVITDPQLPTPAREAVALRHPRSQSGRPTTSPIPLLLGYNTDWSGFLADLQHLAQEVAGRECLVLGAGGSARAVVYALVQAEAARVDLVARRPEQAEALITDIGRETGLDRLKAYPWPALADITAGLAPEPLIVNTTTLGMTPYTKASPWPAGLAFPKAAFIYDLVYNPAETRLMAQARQSNCPAANGLGMLLHQGARAFVLWTGRLPDITVMAAALSA